MADNVPLDLKAALDTSQQSGEIFIGIMTEAGIPRFLAAPFGHALAGTVFLGAILFIGLIASIKQVFVPLSIALLQIIDTIRQDGAPEFAKISLSILSEFLGVEFEGVDLSTGKGADANMERAKQIGTLFQDRLTTEFGGTPTDQMGPGERAAKTFSGYLINFGTTNAMLSMIAEMVSDDHLTQIRELGVEVAQNLGLGRLHRSAMKPLVDALIVHPYSRELADKYRQTRLSQGEALKAFNSGRLDESTVRKILAEKGFPDESITELIAQSAPGLKEHELYELVRAGELPEDEALKHMTDGGVPALVAARRLRVLQLQRIAAERRAYLDEILSLAKERFIDPITYGNLLDREKLPDEEAQFWRNRLGVYLDSEHKRLTFAQIHKLLLHNQANLGELDAWAKSLGYNDNDEFMLEQIINIDEADATAKAAAAVRKAQAAAAKAAAGPGTKKKPPVTPAPAP